MNRFCFIPGLLLNALSRHTLVIVGEIHHRPAYLSLLTEVATAPEFAGGVVYLELPSHRQEEVDQFLANNQLADELVLQVLRDMMNRGWPDQATLEFFRQVWKANQGRPDKQRVRIVLADVARPYDQVRSRKDLSAWERIDRDEYMSEFVQRDLSGPSKGRKALFIVGFGHAACGMRLQVGGFPMRSAGWRLRQAFPDAYLVLEHGPVMTNNGHVKGRAALGLFDEAFAAMGNRPLAFRLAQSPFAPLFFDRLPERMHVGSYGQAFDAYLFLKPLEEEVFSPLIDGFYDEAFVKEIMRRAQISRGSDLQETSAEEFTAQMKQVWGQPRTWSDRLGPTDAWTYGSTWQDIIAAAKYKEALSQPDTVLRAVARLFEDVRKAPTSGQKTLWKLNYMVDHHFDRWIEWVQKTFASDPVEKVELGRFFENDEHLPTVEYRLILRSGRRLEGNLPFRYDALGQTWYGFRGLDWHLDRPTTASAPPSQPD